jgi:cyclophilin family peptidyl-prolyl cis-trans isomerase
MVAGVVNFLALPLRRAAFGIACASAPIFLQAASPTIDPLPSTVQAVPIGKTLVVPVAVSDSDDDPVSISVASNKPGLTAQVRTGYPLLRVHVSYTDSGGNPQTGTMEFLLFRDFTPKAAQVIAGLASAEYYNGKRFHRVLAGDLIQGGSMTGTDPSVVQLENEFHPALIYSGDGQLGIASAGFDANYEATGSEQFFVTMNQRRELDFRYTIFGQLVRGFDVLEAISGIPVTLNSDGELSEPVNPVTITSAEVVPSIREAVLLLSATKLGTGTITVTAVDPGGTPVTATMSANGVVDTINDPPFMRKLPDLVTPPNKSVVVRAQATDLEWDMLSFGAEFVGTSGSNATGLVNGSVYTITPNPGFTGPIDFAIAVFGDDGSYDVRPFRIGAGDKGLRPGATQTLATLEGSALSSVTIGSFVDADLGGTATNFTATVNWGDGTPNESGTVVAGSSGNNGKTFFVKGSHLYAEDGAYLVRVQVDGNLGARTEFVALVNVSETFKLTPQPLRAKEGSVKNRVVAIFEAPGAVAGDFTAEINWGDGAITGGTITSPAPGVFHVLGSHRFRFAQEFVASVEVSNATDSSHGWTSIQSVGFASPKILPPYSQSNVVPRIAYYEKQHDGNKRVIATQVQVFNTGNKVSKAGKLRLYLSDDLVLSPSTDVHLRANGNKFDLDLPEIKPNRGIQFSLIKSGNVDFRIPIPAGVEPVGMYLIAQTISADPIGDLMPKDDTSEAGLAPKLLISQPVPLVTTEGGGTVKFRVALDTVPTGNVTMTLTSSNTAEGTVSPATVTFEPAHAMHYQDVTLTGVDDSVDDGDKTWTIVTGAFSSSDSRFSGVNPPDLTATNKDND